MAGDWIKMRGNLWDDPRITRLCDLTEASEATIVGGLYWLWATADQHTEDGVMPGLSIRQIDRKTGIPGFGTALISIGWVADHPEGIRICNFEDHNGASAKKRCQTAKRVATFKSGNAEVTQQALPKDGIVVTTALPREEKRREEVKTVPKGTDGDAVSSPAVLTKTELWTAGKSLLATQGMPEKQCGSFVGKLVKDYGDGVVIDAVRAAVIARPADAAEYLKATCQHAAGQRQRPDIARITVPGRTSPDPELIRLEMESKNATPMPDHIREHIKRIKGQA